MYGYIGPSCENILLCRCSTRDLQGGNRACNQCLALINHCKRAFKSARGTGPSQAPAVRALAQLLRPCRLPTRTACKATQQFRVQHTRVGGWRLQPNRRAATTVVQAKSDSAQFDVDSGAPAPLADGEAELGPRDDDVLPDSLADSIEEAAKATAEAIQRGNTRTQVELHLPEFWDPISGPMFPNRGDQDRFWRMTRRFMEQLSESLGSGMSVRAVYPDAGVAAMLSYQWQDRSFSISSLNDRRPVQPEDEIVVIACPDPPGADDCMKLVRGVSSQDEQAGTIERPIVLFNQRMSSGDVGLGLNARRIRGNFLKPFVVTYSLRPIGELGSVFRRYPGMWKVFIEEEAMPGRYRLISETPSRPQGEALDYMIQQALNPGASEPGPDGQPKQPSLVDQLRTTMNSLNYFMKSLRN